MRLFSVAMLIMALLSSPFSMAQMKKVDSFSDRPLVRQWPGPDGKPLPFETVGQVLEFLRRADIKDKALIDEGTTGVQKVLLEKDGIEMNAVFRDVAVYKPVVELESGAKKLHFRDDAIFECAAFELSLLLNMKYIPPVVTRKIGGKKGTLQFWVESAVMEKQLRAEKTKIPDNWLWAMQHQVMLIFDNLIYNEDRNLGNVLFTPDWKMMLIDHTRSFRLTGKLLNPDLIRYCERRLFDALKNLNRAQVDQRMSPYLTSEQIKALMKRRDLLVEHIDKLIKEHGEKKVLFRFYRVEHQ